MGARPSLQSHGLLGHGAAPIRDAVEQVIRRRSPASRRTVKRGVSTQAEAIEGRLLLSAYAPSALAYFGLAPNGATPVGTLVSDASGNLYGVTQSGGAYNRGTIYELANGSTAATTLASFDLTNGGQPETGLVIDSAGNLYGTTAKGGDYDYGTVYELPAGSNAITALSSFTSLANADSYCNLALDASGNLYSGTGSDWLNNPGSIYEIAQGTTAQTTLARFNGANGSGPNALTVDSAGNIYGTEPGGGTYGVGAVFELPKGSSAITTLALMDGTDATSDWGSLTLDPSGNLFGTSSSGGGTGNWGSVFEVARGSAAVTILAAFNNTDGSGPIGPPTLDAAGDLFGATGAGGAYDDGTAYEIASGSNAITTIATFNGANGLSPVGGVILNSSGNLYGTTRLGGTSGNGNISGNVFEIAHGSKTITQLAAFSAPNPGPPNSVMLDSAGDLLGTTAQGGPFNDGTVFELPRGSSALTTFASFNGTNGSQPTGLTVDASGNLYGTTALGGPGNYGTVFEIASGSTSVTTIATFSSATGQDPNMVTLDAAGNLFGTTQTNVAGGVEGLYEIASGSNAITVLASFNGSNGFEAQGPVTLDAAGNLCGTTTDGGPANDGTVWESAKGSNAITTLHLFSGGADGSHPLAGLTLDAAGNLFGTTQQGGASLQGTIFEFPDGAAALTTLASFNGTNGIYPQSTVVPDPAGNLFGTTYSGGANGKGVVYEIAKGSSNIVDLLSFDPAEPYGGGPTSLTPDGLGNFYMGTSMTGGAATGALVELAANTTVKLKLASGPNPSDPTQPLNFSATVSGGTVMSGGVPNGGKVTLVDANHNNAVLSAGTLYDGLTTMFVPGNTLSVGTHDLIAVYGGSAGYAVSESAPYIQSVHATPPVSNVRPRINGDDPNGLFNAAGQKTPGTQRSMVEDIVYYFNEPVVINDANAAFTVAVAGPGGGTVPTTLFASAVAGSNGTRWAVSLTGQAEGILASIANGEYSIQINPAGVFAAADGTTTMATGTGRTDSFYRLFGDVNGDRVVNALDNLKLRSALSTYNPIFDSDGNGVVDALDNLRFGNDMWLDYFGDGFVTTI